MSSRLAAGRSHEAQHARRTAWSEFLRLLCPGESDTLLLRACLLEGEPSARAYSQWVTAVGCPEAHVRADRSGRKRLLPLLDSSLRAAGVAPDDNFAAVLKAARGWEHLRWESFRAEASSILDWLSSAGLDFTLLPGAALVPSVYEDGRLRHSHDLDLWLPPRERSAAAGILTERGATVLQPASDDRASSVFRARSKLQVSLHTRLSPLRLFEPPRELTLARRRTVVWNGREVSTLSATDLLLHVCRLAVCSPSRRNLQWACDAFRLIRCPLGIDWGYLRQVARETGSSLPLSVLLAYLRDELGVEIPVVTHLESDVDLSARLEETLCNAAVVGQPISVGQIFRRMPTARLRFAVARHLLLPSPAFLSRERNVEGIGGIATEYASRLSRALTRVVSVDLRGRALGQ